MLRVSLDNALTLDVGHVSSCGSQVCAQLHYDAWHPTGSLWTLSPLEAFQLTYTLPAMVLVSSLQLIAPELGDATQVSNSLHTFQPAT